MIAAALLLGAGFAVLAGFVAAGTADGLDRYAVHHWMPGLEPAAASENASLVGALVPFYGMRSWDGLDLAATVVTLPAYILVSSVLFAFGLRVLWCRGSAVEAALWAAVFVGANAAEVVSKALLTRPALRADGAHLVAFDSSYPSGHALRTCLVAALVVRLWPRAWAPVALWTAASLALLVAAGVHTVTDVIGGMLLAAFGVALVPAGRTRIDRARREPRRRAGPRTRG